MSVLKNCTRKSGLAQQRCLCQAIDEILTGEIKTSVYDYDQLAKNLEAANAFDDAESVRAMVQRRGDIIDGLSQIRYGICNGFADL